MLTQDLDFIMQDETIENSMLFRMWTRPKSPESEDESYLTSPRKHLEPPPGLGNKPVIRGIVSYNGFCFHCNRHGHKPSYTNGCTLEPIEESRACRRAKEKIRLLKKNEERLAPKLNNRSKCW